MSKTNKKSPPEIIENIDFCIAIAEAVDQNMLDATAYKAVLDNPSSEHFFKAVEENDKRGYLLWTDNVIRLSLLHAYVMCLCRIWDSAKGKDRMSIPRALDLLKDDAIKEHFIKVAEDRHFICHDKRTKAIQQYENIENIYSTNKLTISKLKDIRDTKLGHTLTFADARASIHITLSELDELFKASAEATENLYLFIKGTGTNYEDTLNVYMEAPSKFYEVLNLGFQRYQEIKEQKKQGLQQSDFSVRGE